MVEVTEARVKLVPGRGRLLAFATITLGHCFRVTDLKVLRGNRGPVVVVPNREVKDRCPSCGAKNVLRAKFCNWCGATLNTLTTDGPLFADLAYAITGSMRDAVSRAVLSEYERVRNGDQGQSSVSQQAPRLYEPGMGYDEDFEDYTSHCQSD